MNFHIDREKYIESGLVNEQSHPTLPLLIYNYSQKCQFAKAWDEVTLMCRGLIVNKETREIVARPFSKFFNYEEYIASGKKIPDEIPYVLKKLDGSLGILYWVNDEPMIATRGSFMSEQAQWATKWIRANIDCSKFDKRLTYLFEIIYPANRIVVSYGFSGLVLLDVINIETGLRAIQVPVPKELMLVEVFPFSSYDELKKLNTPNEEGFVLFFPTSQLRLKIKFQDYVRLHKVMTGLSEIGIWEMLRDGKDPITPEIPDEMHGWISGVVNDLKTRFAEIEREAEYALIAKKQFETRKEQAMYIKNTMYPGITFSMLDGKDFKKGIWSMIRPRGARTFKKDIDA